MGKCERKQIIADEGSDVHYVEGCSASFFFFQAEDGIRDYKVTGVQTCALPIWPIRWPGCRPDVSTVGAPGAPPLPGSVLNKAEVDVASSSNSNAWRSAGKSV